MFFCKKSVYLTLSCLIWMFVLANRSNAFTAPDRQDSCSSKTCANNEVCIESAEEALCVEESRIINMDSHHHAKQRREAAMPRVYYPGVCGVEECRYGECEIYNSTYFRCHCTKGVTGTNCDQLDTTGKPCASNPCYGDAKCYDVTSSTKTTQFVCVCQPGRTGLWCEGHTGSCQCQANGVCKQLSINSYKCDCLQPYGGHLCQYYLGATEFCKNQPCRNGGTCTWQSTCKCASGFTGTFCETARAAVTTISASATPTTLPSTTVVPRVDTTTPSICTSTICKNGGTCYQFSANIAICLCKSGFSGPFCELGATSPTTTPTTTTTTTTTIGTTTTTTTTAASQACPAGINPCQNGGTCSIQGGNIVCKCVAPFTGLFCLDQQPFCASSPCKNGAQCLPLGAQDGACICTSNEFQGKFCEVSLTCNPNPCKNGQQCLNINGSARCFCSAFFTGTFCETPV